MYNQEKIGRYPHGFRHLENYANYSQVKRGTTIQDYMEEMNRPAEFHEFLAIQRQHMIEESHTPEFEHQFRREVLNELNRKNFRDPQKEGDYSINQEDLAEYKERKSCIDTVEEFVVSDLFIKDCRQRYSEKVQTALLEKETYKVVEALEETMDFWRVGRHMFHMPIHNVYIPVKNTIMKKPNLLNQDLESDELGYRYHNYDDNVMTR